MEYCEHCEKALKDPVWLELSQTDGRYYFEVPTGHVSQGFFPFGQSCSRSIAKHAK